MDVKSTCSHRSFAGQSQEAFLLQDKTRSDKRAGAHSQGETDVEVLTIHLHLKAKKQCKTLHQSKNLCISSRRDAKRKVEQRHLMFNIT